MSDLHVKLERYEAWVLSALGCAEDPPLRQWATAYRALSTVLTETREVLESQASTKLGGEDARAVAALVFGARTFALADRILDAYPCSGPLLEVGAGSGPFALAAALRGAPVTLLDCDSDSLELGRHIFDAAGQSAPDTIVGDMNQARTGFGSVALPFSLNEAVQGTGPERAAQLIERWMAALPDGGRLYVLEPGLKDTTQALQEVRDRLRSLFRILAPCPQSEHDCPLPERDWCHLTWSLGFGPRTRQLADLARRRHSQTHFSWLVLEKSPPRPRESGARILELRYPENRKVTALACCPQGAVIRATALKRKGSAFEALSETPAGALVALEWDRLEEKGDGHRVPTPDLWSVLRPL